jgi:hypothetical protein
LGKKPQIVIDSERRYQEKLDREAKERGSNGNGHSAASPTPEKPKSSAGHGQIYQRVLPPLTSEGDRKQASTSRQTDQQRRAANSRLNDEYSDDENGGHGHDFGFLKQIVQVTFLSLYWIILNSQASVVLDLFINILNKTSLIYQIFFRKITAVTFLLLHPQPTTQPQSLY